MSRPGSDRRHWGGEAHRKDFTEAEHEEGHIRQMTSRGTIAVLVSLAVFLYLIRTVLLPFVLAGAIAYVATPGIDAAARRTRLPRTLWAILFFVVLVATLGVIGGSVPLMVHVVGMSSPHMAIGTSAIAVASAPAPETTAAAPANPPM